MKIGIKEAGKDVVYTETEEKYRHDCVKKVLGTIPEYVRLAGDEFTLAVDENGLLNDLPTNFLIETMSETFPIQKMPGTAVFVRIKPCDIFAEDFHKAGFTTMD